LLGNQVIAVSVAHGRAGTADLCEYLSVVAVAVDHELGGDSILGFHRSDAIGVVAVCGDVAQPGHFDKLVAAIIGLAGDLADFGFRQGVAVGIVAVDRVNAVGPNWNLTL
tara:strand:+ start:30 stop:359 length:330 start_codon:yes stop_codon:yes gene_type:complete